MGEYDTNYTPAYNRFVTQFKQYRDVLTPEEWNNIINVLAAQGDSHADQILKVHEYLSSGAAASIVLTNEDEPDILGDFYFKIET
jgi:hypothetical protein